MAICDIYTATSTSTAVAATSATPLLMLGTASTKRAFIVGIRVSIGTTAATAGNNVLFQLVRAGNSPTGGSLTGTNVANDSAAPNPLTTATDHGWTLAPTVGSVLWQMQLPQTTGSSWEEFPPLGYEWAVPVSGFVAVFATPSVSTSTPCMAELVYGE